MKTEDLVSVGMSMGMLHVIAGPDHLSALAALSVGNSWRAVWMGIKWGLGHSTGLVAVACMFIAAKGDIDLRAIGKSFDFVVGLFMIGIGLHGFWQLYSIRKDRNAKKNDMDLEAAARLTETVALKKSDTPVNHQHRHVHGISAHGEKSVVRSKSSSQLKESSEAESEEPSEQSGEGAPSSSSSFMQHLLSFVIGLIHGVAGPGGVLGVLPAVEMTSVHSSVVYLGSFILASTLSMGLFAALYGEITRRMMNSAAEGCVEYALRTFSCGMSVLCGLLWLFLCSQGRLEEFFH
jgi:hypothetical protein